MSSSTQPIPLHTSPTPPTTTPPPNPLPTLLQTPSGLALLELQGTINLPPTTTSQTPAIPIGRLIFPDYNPTDTSNSSGDTAWMKRAWLFIGENQRLQGEVKRLPKAVAVLRRRSNGGSGGGVGVEGGDGDGDGDGDDNEGAEELEVVEVVKFKIVFSLRPEPVGSESLVA
ncbi:Ctf8-domain-containing protein [Chaetomium fimeti]|uniref:Ctf8-domain-containing protein n=1 Tax=Chaetomium fimeti TaxID=1854472 RepID=A0AAE0HCQ6_9PEZI|nr:Ctf8-domain-containing protein [Chaetomium fimeti]